MQLIPNVSNEHVANSTSSETGVNPFRDSASRQVQLWISQFHLRPALPPGYGVAFTRLVSPGGWGICKFCTARGSGICQPQGHSRAFDTHAASFQNKTTQKVLPKKKKQIGSSVKDRNKLKRVVKACSRFYACISSLLIKQEFIHSENRSCRFWLLNQISVDIIWRTSFHIYKTIHNI